MNRVAVLLFLISTITFSMNCQLSNGNSSRRQIVLESHPIDNNSNHKIHRLPLRINIEAYYDIESNSIDIIYNGELTGEVFLYVNDIFADYNGEINSSFLVRTTGIYKIEIHTETWIATGQIQI